MDFNLIDTVISVESTDATALMYFLMQSGGRYSTACRTICCRWPLRTCDTCSQNVDCIYFRVFSQELSNDPEAVRRHQKPPLPFAFSFFPDSQNCCLDCRLVVVGGAIHSLEFLLQGFEELIGCLEVGLCTRIRAISTRNYMGDVLSLGSTSHIKHPENLMVLSVSDIVKNRSWVHRSVTLQLFSPLRILSDKHQIRTFQFGLFIRSIIRRVTAIACCYGDCDVTADFKKLALLSHETRSVSESFTFSSLPGGSIKLSGIVGEGSFTGEFSDIIPFLILGSYLNVGKGASFGMGSYTLTMD